ncbi:MAG: hypothetical protein H0W71_04170 [Sphingomonas sp.]|nr:hypothetical protein [Sphingomonas sp.]
MRLTLQGVIRRVLHGAWLFIALLAALTIITASPALAHKDHKKAVSTEQSMNPAAQGGAPVSNSAEPTSMHSQMGEMMGDMEMDRSKMTFLERLVAWIGGLHPLVVHFPIAFFPAALFTAIVGRRRPAFAAPVQFLVVAGGIIAPFAAVAGWFAGMSADPEPILAYHRWLGVAVGLTGAALGIWAWKRPWEDRGAGMIVALTIMTIAIVAQGFMGAAITHGMEHMMF